MVIAAGEFKSKCLKLMDYVQKSHDEVIISKRGKPVAKLVPVEEYEDYRLFGLMRGSVVREGDIVSPLGEEWNAGR